MLPFAWPLAGVVLALALIGAQEVRVQRLKTDLANEQAKAADIRAAGFAAGVERTEANALNLKTANDAIGKALNDEREKSSAALAASTAHADTARRLQQYANKLAANCDRKSKGSTGSGGNQAPDSSGLVLAELSRGLDERGSKFARFAEQAMIAAETCSAYADSLEPLR